MKKTVKKNFLRILVWSVVFAMIFGAFPASAQSEPVSENPENTDMAESKIYFDPKIGLSSGSSYLEDSIIIEIFHSASLEDPSKFTAEYLGLDGVKSVNPLFARTWEGIMNGKKHLANVAKTFHQSLAVELEEPGLDNVLSMIKAAESHPDVMSASPNIRSDISPDSLSVPAEAQQNISAYSSMSYPYNDPDLQQPYWAYEAINLYEAWEITTGSRDVKVGVIDFGVSVVDELEPNLIPGWNFDNDSDDPSATEIGHGNTVSSVIGAVANNGIGMAGISPEVSIAPLKFYSDIQDAADALDWCNENEIAVVNASWGSPSQLPIVDTAIQNYYGLIVFAAGNDSQLNLELSARYPVVYDHPNMITVGGTNDGSITNRLAYSPKYVDIGAPSNNLRLINEYGNSTVSGGTSYSAPMVTGTIALMWSVNPDLIGDNETTKRLLLDSAAKHPQLVGYYKDGNFLDVAAAVRAALNAYGTPAETPNILSSTPDVTASVGDSTSISVSASVSRGTLSYQWYETATGQNSGGTAIAGAASRTYSPSTASAGVKYYYCAVTNTDESATGSKTASINGPVISVTVTEPVLNFEITKLSISGTQELSFTVLTQGGTQPLEYAFYIIGGGKVHYKEVYSDSNSFSYTPEERGNYTVRAYVMDSTGKRLVISESFSQL